MRFSSTETCWLVDQLMTLLSCGIFLKEGQLQLCEGTQTRYVDGYYGFSTRNGLALSTYTAENAYLSGSNVKIPPI